MPISHLDNRPNRGLVRLYNTLYINTASQPGWLANLPYWQVCVVALAAGSNRHCVRDICGAKKTEYFVGVATPCRWPVCTDAGVHASQRRLKTRTLPVVRAVLHHRVGLLASMARSDLFDQTRQLFKRAHSAVCGGGGGRSFAGLMAYPWTTLICVKQRYLASPPRPTRAAQIESVDHAHCLPDWKTKAALARPLAEHWSKYSSHRGMVHHTDEARQRPACAVPTCVLLDCNADGDGLGVPQRPAESAIAHAPVIILDGPEQDLGPIDGLKTGAPTIM